MIRQAKTAGTVDWVANSARPAGRGVRRWVAFLLAGLVGTGCQSIPLAAEPQTRTLVIENPAEAAMTLRRVGGDSLNLGRAPMVFMQLETGLYVLDCGGCEHPVPLHHATQAPPIPMTIPVSPAVQPPRGFAFVPGGPTLIGDVLGVGATDERPARVEWVGPLFVAVAETTNAEYGAFLNAIGRCEPDWLDLGGPKCGIARNDAGHFVVEQPDWPVVTVSFPGAQAYCAWKSEVTGLRVRLPTETEWERFARGPASSTYAYADVYDPEAANQESGTLMPTRSFPAAGWGLYDVTGNAFEWTASDYRAGLKVLKGGSYVLDGPYLRNSFRMWYRPLVRADDIGFRVVCEVQP